jgi:hypothetical protein
MSERANGTGLDYGKGRGYLFPWTTDGSGIGIFAYCDAANTAGLAGHADWRMPNILEVLSILDFNTILLYSAWNIYCEPWASTSLNSTTAYRVFGGTGIITDTKIYAAQILLVRGSPTAPTAGGNSLISGMVD